MQNISISMNPEILEQITEYCNERGCTRSWFFNKASELYLKEFLEDKIDYEIGVSAYKEFEADNFRSFSSEEVFKQAGLL